MRFTKIPEDTFERIQLNAGVLLSDFNVTTPPTGDEMLANIVGATSGGVTFTAAATYSDYGEDIDNCPKNTLELKKLDTWAVTMSGSYVTVTAESVASMLGAADAADGKVTPRTDVLTTDFKDLWWVGDYSDKNGETNGGMIAIHMLNTLSTGGFQLKSSDKSKGTFSFEYTAHYSIAAQTTVPFEIYVKSGTAETTG